MGADFAKQRRMRPGEAWTNNGHLGGLVTLLPVAPQGVPLHPKSEGPTLSRRAIMGAAYGRPNDQATRRGSQYNGVPCAQSGTPTGMASRMRTSGTTLLFSLGFSAATSMP